MRHNFARWERAAYASNTNFGRSETSPIRPSRNFLPSDNTSYAYDATFYRPDEASYAYDVSFSRKNHSRGHLTGVSDRPKLSLLRMRRLFTVQSYVLRV